MRKIISNSWKSLIFWTRSPRWIGPSSLSTSLWDTVGRNFILKPVKYCWFCQLSHSCTVLHICLLCELVLLVLLSCDGNVTIIQIYWWQSYATQNKKKILFTSSELKIDERLCFRLTDKYLKEAFEYLDDIWVLSLSTGVSINIFSFLLFINFTSPNCNFI